MTLGVQVHSLISWHEYVQQCYQVYAYVLHWSTSSLKCTQVTFGISMPDNIFPKRLNHHLKYPNVLL